tara:strand:- start:397 stop:813 length:417 start_codon:yes stop_codon:yes gene_type:complete
MSEETLDTGDERMDEPRELGAPKTGVDTDRPTGAASDTGGIGGEVHGESRTVVVGGVSGTAGVSSEQEKVWKRVGQISEEILELNRQLLAVATSLKSLRGYVTRFHPEPPRTCEACGRTLESAVKGNRHPGCTNSPHV